MVRVKVGVLDFSGCYNKNTTGWVARKQWALISDTSGGSEVPNQGTSRFGVWCGLAAWFIGSTFSLCPHVMEGVRDLSGASL